MFVVEMKTRLFDIIFSIRMKRDLYDAIKRAAARDRRTIVDYIRIKLEDATKGI